MKKLSNVELVQYLDEFPSWKINEFGHLAKLYSFSSFSQAMFFVSQVAELAEQHQHHPKIEIDFKEVVLELWTKDLDALSLQDLMLADLCDSIPMNIF